MQLQVSNLLSKVLTNKKNLRTTRISWWNLSKFCLKKLRQDSWNISWWCGTIILKSQQLKKSTIRWSKYLTINCSGKSMSRKNVKWRRSLKTKRLPNNSLSKENRLQTLMWDHLCEQLQTSWLKISQTRFKQICQLSRNKLSLNRKSLLLRTNLILKFVERQSISLNNNMQDCLGVSNLE